MGLILYLSFFKWTWGSKLGRNAVLRSQAAVSSVNRHTGLYRYRHERGCAFRSLACSCDAAPPGATMLVYRGRKFSYSIDDDKKKGANPLPTPFYHSINGSRGTARRKKLPLGSTLGCGQDRAVTPDDHDRFLPDL